MNQATLYDFESEKIKIDYLTFNIKNTEHNLQKIAQFFNRVISSIVIIMIKK